MAVYIIYFLYNICQIKYTFSPNIQKVTHLEKENFELDILSLGRDNVGYEKSFFLESLFKLWAYVWFLY